LKTPDINGRRGSPLGHLGLEERGFQFPIFSRVVYVRVLVDADTMVK